MNSLSILRSTSIALLSMSLCLTSCSKSPESIMKESLGLMNEMADLMGTMKDKESALAAKTKMAAIGAKLKALKDANKDFNKNDPELEKKFEPEVKAITEKMTKAAMSLSSAGPEALEVMTEMGKLMQEMDK